MDTDDTTSGPVPAPSTDVVPVELECITSADTDNVVGSSNDEGRMGVLSSGLNGSSVQDVSESNVCLDGATRCLLENDSVKQTVQTEDQRTLRFEPLKISLYEFMLQQLIDDGFSDIASQLSRAANIDPYSDATPNTLFRIYERISFSTALHSAAQLVAPSLAGARSTATDFNRVGPLPSRLSPEDIAKLASEIADASTGSSTGIPPTGSTLKWSPMFLEVSPAILPEEPILDFDRYSVLQSNSSPGSFSQPNFPVAVPPRTAERWTAAHKAACTAVACTPNARYCASGGEDAAVRVMSLRSEEAGCMRDELQRGSRIWTRVFVDHQSTVTCLSFHPTLPVLFSGSSDRTIQIFDLSRSLLKKSCASIQDLRPLSCIAAHPCGDFLLAACTDGIVRFYDLNTLQSYASMWRHHQHTGLVKDIRCSSTGSVFATCSTDGSIKIWDSVNNRVANSMVAAHNGAPVQTARWSRSNCYLLSSGLDGLTKLWDIRMGKELLVIGTTASRSVDYNVSAFLKDELYIANINSDPQHSDTLFYSSYTGKLISSLQVHPGRVTNLETVPFEMSMVTACSDYRCRLIDVFIIDTDLKPSQGSTSLPFSQHTTQHSSTAGSFSQNGSNMPPFSGGAFMESEEMSIDL